MHVLTAARKLLPEASDACKSLHASGGRLLSPPWLNSR